MTSVDQRDLPAGADQVPTTSRHRRGTGEAPTHLTIGELRGAVAFLLHEYLSAKGAGDEAGAEGARALYVRAYRSLVVLYDSFLSDPERSASRHLATAPWPDSLIR